MSLLPLGSMTPTAQLVQGAKNPDQMLLGVLGTARVGTVRARLRDWGRLVRWLVAHGYPCWPTSAKQIVEYLHDGVAEGFPKSFPRNTLAAVHWMETRSGLGSSVHLAGEDLLKKTAGWAETQLDAAVTPVRKALQFPVGLVVALEVFVCDETSEYALRVVAWTRLLKYWAALRQDDLLRIAPEDVEARAGALQARLTRTKTSGTGKKVRELPVTVPSTASYTGLPWATVGFGLFQAVEPSGRRWFLPRPMGDLSGFTTRVISNTESSWVARLVLSKLRVPAYDLDTGLWGSDSREYLLKGEWPRIWSTHSERASLVSLLATAGVGKDERNLIGRWSPEGSDDLRAHVSSGGQATCGHGGQHSA